MYAKDNVEEAITKNFPGIRWEVRTKTNVQNSRGRVREGVVGGGRQGKSLFPFVALEGGVL